MNDPNTIPSFYTDTEVSDLWKKDVCDHADEIDPDCDQSWPSIWIGFVIGIGRRDLADYTNYMELGFPSE